MICGSYVLIKFEKIIEMKTNNRFNRVKLSAILILPFLLVQFACNKNDVNNPNDDTKGITDLIISDNFDWSTSVESAFKVTILSNNEIPLNGVKVSVYTNDPLEDGSLIVSGVTDENGIYSIDYKVPAYYDSVFLQTEYVGVVSPGMVDISNGGFDIALGGNQQPISTKSISNTKSKNTNYVYLGNYDSNGIPTDYLEPVNDVITQDLLDDINNTLPEKSPLPVSHPEYLQPELDYNLNLIEDCDVWITFVHEGAGYENTLGFYTYETGQTPQTPEDIDEITIIFPNVSYNWSGTLLQSGNKVHLGEFDAGTTISFALIADGWQNGGVTDGKWIVYSNPNLNPITDPALKQHTVLLNDNGRNLLLLGIEDILRKYGSDHDFNDAVFYVTANPIEAIDQSEFPNIDYTGLDTDNDGVPDNTDDYPDDGSKAFDNFFFNEGSYGTLAFEDMWPGIGDYDFNDAVIDYNFNQITNADNDIIEIVSEFKLMAHGASFHNGFGFQLPFDKSFIESVSGDLFVNGTIVSLDNKNLETNQNLPVVIVWEDAYDVLPHQSGGIGVNTTPGITYVVPEILTVTISLTSPVSLSNAGIPPYNPFIFINGQRDVEIHLVDMIPTDLADADLFGTSADNSDPLSGRYYKTSTNLPWAINIIEKFEYPNEKTEITSAHLNFGDWAESDGTLFTDWWKDKTGNRNEDKIYQVPIVN